MKCYIGTNQQEVDEPLYAYKSYLKQLWNRQNILADQYLESQGWELDFAVDGIDLNTAAASIRRIYWVRESQTMEMYGPVMMDFFSSGQYAFEDAV